MPGRLPMISLNLLMVKGDYKRFHDGRAIVALSASCSPPGGPLEGCDTLSQVVGANGVFRPSSSRIGFIWPARRSL